MTRVLVLTLLAAALLPLPLAAQEPIGQVLAIRGEASARAADGTLRSLTRRDAIFERDTLLTGADGLVQVKLVDDSSLSVPRNSELRFDRYRLDGVVMSLMRGCFRAMRGWANESPQDEYRIDTPVASIAIENVAAHGAELAGDVLYTATYSSSTTISGAAGTLRLGGGADYDFSRTLAGEAPEGLITEPDTISWCEETAPGAPVALPAGARNQNSFTDAVIPSAAP